MLKTLLALLCSQFLSAFADNAVLFTIIAMVMQKTEPARWYVPALQSAFLVAFVLLAPYSGKIADKYAKKWVLIGANITKAIGASLLLLHIEPLIAYCVVGVGAAIYSPAKYGILPELVNHENLVKANSWIEGSTILAILLGMGVGAKLADASIFYALILAISLFFVSGLIALLLPVSKKQISTSTNSAFFQQIQQFFNVPRAKFVILGCSLFWATAATLRVILVAWSAIVLAFKNASDVAQLTLFLAVGIIFGSGCAARFISLEKIANVRFSAYGMAMLILGLSFSTTVLNAQLVLFAIGLCGGLFIVPINAMLQELGQHSIGTGTAVALQGFFQNLAMLLAVGSYTVLTTVQISPVVAMQILGVFLGLASFTLALKINKTVF